MQKKREGAMEIFNSIAFRGNKKIGTQMNADFQDYSFIRFYVHLLS